MKNFFRQAPLRLLLAFSIVLGICFALPLHSQETPSAPSSPSSEPAKTPTRTEDGAASEGKSIGRELAKETREASGAEEEENANLKHAAAVQWLGRKLGLSVHQAHLLAFVLNFAAIAGLLFWAARKMVPGMLRDRNASIQQALQEARAASQDANRRLADVETRLRQLDVEIGRMQAAAEKEGAAEESRIQQAAEHDIRKVVETAEHEIASAAKQARRELSAHTASLAVALAQKQIHVDANTDQVLVRGFAAKLSGNDGGKDGR